MSVEMYREVLQRSRSKGPARAALLALAFHHHSEDPTRTIAIDAHDWMFEANCSRATLFKSIAELKELGELAQVGAGGGGRGKVGRWRIPELAVRDRPARPSSKRKAAAQRPLMAEVKPSTRVNGNDEAPKPFTRVDGKSPETVQTGIRETVQTGELFPSRVNAGGKEQGKKTTSQTHGASAVGTGGEEPQIRQFTSRPHALSARCPQCAAAPDAPCRRTDGTERIQCHAARHAHAIALGAPPIDVSKANAARTPRPGPRENGTSPRATGTNLRAIKRSPNQIKAAQDVKDLEDAARAAVAALRSPDASARHDWAAFTAALQAGVPETTWAHYLDGLDLAAVTEEGAFIVAATRDARGWLSTHPTVLERLSAHIGRPLARVASDAELDALRAAA